MTTDPASGSEAQAVKPINLAGVLLTRAGVPLWIVAGAAFKLAEHTPRALPQTVRDLNTEMFNLRPHVWLSLLIGLELLAVGVMLFSRQFARLMVIFMLACFCLILVNEIRLGNFADCGCFGKVPMPPWLTLTIDGALLIGVLVCAPRYRRSGWPLGKQTVAAGVWTAIGFASAFALVLPHGKQIAPPPAGTGDGQTGTEEELPWSGVFFINNHDEWPGQHWSDLDLFRYVKNWPDGMDTGRRYVIFYHKTCDHCQALLESYFAEDPPAPTVIVAIPDFPEGFDTDNELAMFFCDSCVEKRELPIGPDWLLTGPLVVALDGGVIQCFREGNNDPEECLIWH